MPEPKFAIEIPTEKGFPPMYVTVWDGVSSLLYTLHRLPSVDPSTPQPSAMKLEYRVAGDTVFITASVFYGEFDQQRTPVSLEKLPQETVGTYSGKLNDLVTLSALERVGLEPLTVRIVTARSEHPYRPFARSNAPSLQIDYAPVDRTMGTVTVRNLSGKAVVALQVGGSDDSSGWGHGEHRVIVPGASYQFQTGVRGHSGRMVNGSFVEDPPPADLVLQAALFEDGSYEGDIEIAARMAAFQNGAKVQRQRMESLVEPILADAQSDDEAKMGRIRTAVAQLSVASDLQMMATLRKQFPALPDRGIEQVKSEFAAGMKSEKENAVYLLQAYEETNRAGDRAGHRHIPLAHWWALGRKKD